MRIVGIVLIVIGVISLAIGGISYTKREKVIDLGPIEATAETAKDHSAAAAARRSGAGRGRRASDCRIEKALAGAT